MQNSATSIPAVTPHAHTRRYEQPRVEAADIFRRFGAAYCATHKLSLLQHQAMRAVTRCRTKALGGETKACTQCGYVEERYLSCRNRHCPKCQGAARWKWVNARLAELLPVPYYHVVTTLPEFLNVLALYNKEIIYEIFYQASAATLVTFGRDPKYLGAQLGLIAILHTWGQTLNYHVHWHFIVTAGGIAADEPRWKPLPYRKKFLFPAEAVAMVIRGKFIALLDKAYREGKLQFPPEMGYLNHAAEFADFKDKIRRQAFYCYAKPPFAGPEKLIKYIGSYTHRVAISNHRLLNIEAGNITFSYKDYRNEGQRKEMTLRWDVFIRRWLWHVVPKNFRRIRHGGFLAGNTRRKKMALARQLLEVLHQQVLSQAPEGVAQCRNAFDSDFGMKCPWCQSGTMILIESFTPPWQRPYSITRRRFDSS